MFVVSWSHLSFALFVVVEYGVIMLVVFWSLMFVVLFVIECCC